MPHPAQPVRSSPSGKPAAPTLQQGLNAIPTWNVPPRRQHTLEAALNKLLELSGKQARADAVRLDPVQSLAVLERASPALSGIADSTLANYRASVRFVLRRLGLLDFVRQQPKAVADPVWAALFAQLPDALDFGRLRAFASDCEAEGIQPGDVGQATLDAYAARRTSKRGGTKQLDHARRVAALWNRAGRDVAGWPATRLGPTPNGRQLSLPYEAYPKTLQAEVNAYLTAISHRPDGAGNRKLFATQGAVRTAVAPRTALTRQQSLRRLLYGAVQGGIPVADINSLGVVTTLPFIETALTWHYERKGEQLTADMAVFAATIASISQYLGITGPAWKAIKQRLDEVTPPARTGMTERNTLILEALTVRETRAALLHLPSMLMEEATRLKDGWRERGGLHHPPRPLEAGWLAQVAVAIEVLLNAPVRMANLHNMRLGQELRLTQVSRTRWRGLVLVDETQAKNRRGVEFPLSPETIALLRRYLAEFRPLVPNAETDWLFSGKAGPDRPRHQGSLGDAIATSIHQYVGLRMNPHAFRAFAGARILARDPHAIDDVRAVLGHSGFQTALVYYRAFNGRAAGDRLSTGLTEERKATAAFVPVLPTRRGSRLWRGQ